MESKIQRIFEIVLSSLVTQAIKIFELEVITHTKMHLQIILAFELQKFFEELVIKGLNTIRFQRKSIIKNNV